MDWLFDTSNFPARWHCGNWTDALGYTHIGADVLIALCYLTIPILLTRFRRLRTDVPFPWLFTLFAVFILSCGSTHLVEAVIFWEPVYYFSAVTKVVTAAASLTTVVALVPALPKLFALQSPTSLRREIEQRKAVESELRALHAELEAKVEARAQALLEQHERLRLIQDAAEMGFWELDYSTQKAELDTRARELFGLDDESDAVASEELLACVDREDRKQLNLRQEALNDAAPSQSPSQAARAEVVQLRLQDGSRVLRTRLVRVASAKRLLAVSWDDTKTHPERAQVRRLLQILEATPDFVVTAQLDGRVVWTNQALESWLGGTRINTLHELLPRYAPGLDAESLKAHIQGASGDGETIARSGDKERAVDPVLVAHDDSAGRLSHVSLILHDLTLQKAREKELKETEARFRAAVDAAPNAMAMVDTAGRIRLHNTELTQLFGYTSEELAELTVDALVPKAQQAQHADNRASFAAAPTRRPMGGDRPLKGLHKDGHLVPLEIGLNPFQHRGEPMTLVAIVDVSERLKAHAAIERREHRLQQMNEDLREFAYAASHDLQEPLRKVSSFCQLLELEAGDALPDPCQDYIRYAVDASQRMQVLIRDLMEYSLLGATEVVLEPVETRACFDHALELLTGPIADSRAQIDVGELPTVLAKDVLLRQVFSNLLSNAIKYRKPGSAPHISVRAQRSAKSWRFEVTDDGIGIDAQHHQRIFGVLKRLHSRDEYPGTGVGLAVVKKAITRCEGDLGVTSAPGQGTTIWFTLRAVPERP